MATHTHNRHGQGRLILTASTVSPHGCGLSQPRKVRTVATIQFKAKPQTIYNPDDTIAYRYVTVPELARRHCNMCEFRQHPKYSGLANSDLFPGVLARIRRDILNGRAYLRLDALPENVTVDASGFLASVTIRV